MKLSDCFLAFFLAVWFCHSAIYEAVEDVSHHHRAKSIHHRMLLQEHGGEADADRQNCGGQADQVVLLQRFTSHDCNVCHDGVVHMDTWKYIGAGICCVQGIYDFRKYILPWVEGWAEICAVWKELAYDQAQGHTHEQIGAETVITALVREEEIHDGSAHEWEPQQVGDDEIFVKWNQVIQPHVHDVIITRNGFLQIHEPWNVDHGIGEYPYMLIF